MSENCWACKGAGYFNEYGKPSFDQYRQCLECRGYGKITEPITRDKIIEAVGKWNLDAPDDRMISDNATEFLLKELGLD